MKISAHIETGARNDDGLAVRLRVQVYNSIKVLSEPHKAQFGRSSQAEGYKFR